MESQRYHSIWNPNTIPKPPYIFSYPYFLTPVYSSFLGRARVPAVEVLHPPRGGADDPITLSLHPQNWQEPRETACAVGNNDENNEGGSDNGDDGVDALEENGGKVVPAAKNNAARAIPDKRAIQAEHHQHGPSRGAAAAAAGKTFANKMIGNVQKHLAKSEVITGTLTLSLETFDDDKQEGRRHPRNRRGGGGSESVVHHESMAYATARFKVAEDADTARMRRRKEGIEVPRMLSRVQALHDRLEGDVT